MNQPQQGLKIAIIGAGLAGTLTARILRPTHTVTIYERAQDAIELGAAVSIGPNGVQILDELGFDRENAGSIPQKLLRVYDQFGKLVSEREMDYRGLYGADFLVHHRVDIRNEFLRLATADSGTLGLEGEPARVRWGCEVVSVDAEGGRIGLAGGEVVEADLVIAADGIKSTARSAVVGDAALAAARPTGLSAFRFTLEAEKVEKALGGLPDILQPDRPMCLTLMFATDGTRRGVVMYPCRGFQLLNCVCFVPDEKLKSQATLSWSAPGDREELLENFSDYPDWILGYLRLAENIKLWKLHDQDPIPTYARGRTVLIGDAAHAMTPHQGQGATQAVEDAEGFRLFLRPGITRDNVPDILKDFDSVRRARATQVQSYARATQAQKKPEDVLKYERFCYTYPGIVKALERVEAGEDIVQV